MMKSSNRPLLIVMIITMVIFGGALIYFTMEYLAQVTQPGNSPSAEVTSHQIGMWILVVTMLAGMPAVGFGAYVMYVGSRIRATQQWPPSGMGFRAKAPVLLGDRALLLGAVVMGLGFVLVVCGLILPVVGWKLGNAFLE
ncbi:MAG: hypothetical protein OEW33_00670 [Nitrospirota bacterium]|nr:hypothetical protein [Nitrospirota bacterium]